MKPPAEILAGIEGRLYTLAKKLKNCDENLLLNSSIDTRARLNELNSLKNWIKKEENKDNE